VNASLCRGNHSEMFVTAFYGILDIRTGELHYSNGGHNPPCVLGRGSKPKVLDGETGGTVLGGMQDMSYETGRTVLRSADTILLYTDGVTEAMDCGGNQFSLQRLQAFLQRADVSSAEEIVHGVVGVVQEFAAGAPQSDDLTVLAVRYLAGS
jgi:sigma-B regulation protein RsbU (phosphoserine phosphatase)